MQYGYKVKFYGTCFPHFTITTVLMPLNATVTNQTT